MSEINRCEGPSRSPVYHEEEPSEPLGGQCKSASSDASKVATQSSDNPQLRDSLRTQAIDRPLEDDVIGNLIPGAIVGGAGAAVRAGGASLGAMATAAAKKVATKLASGAAKHAAVESLKRSVDVTTLDAPANVSQSSASSGGAAGVSRGGASVPVTEPNESKVEPEAPPVGQDRSPYAPGYAPIRIPEAPVVIRG